MPSLSLVALAVANMVRPAAATAHIHRHARTTTNLGTTVVFVGAPGQSSFAVWLQGNYVAILYGRDQQAMSAFIAALVANNQ